MKLRALALLLLPCTGIVFAQFPPQIKNVVVIFQENRSPDNLFHFLTPACPLPKGVGGLAACMPSPVTTSCYDISPCGISNEKGEPVPITLRPVEMSDNNDPDHSFSGFENMCDPDPVTMKCRNDGAWRTSGENYSYSFVANPPVINYDGSAGHLLDPYLTLAKRYGWANFMYQTNKGPSYPAHQIMFAGTAALTAADDANSTFLAGNFYPYNDDNFSGCLAPADSTNELVSPVTGTPPAGCMLYNDNSVQQCTIGNTSLLYPTDPVGSFCVSHQSMADILDPKSVSWKYYATAPGWIWSAPDAIQAICQPAFVQPNGNPNSPLVCTGKEWNANVDTNKVGTDILRDITNCNLSKVSWVTPNGAWSDHAVPGDLYGPSWVAAIVNAIGTNKTCPTGTPDAGQNYWQDTAIVVTWDDWGGFSDNQPPPAISSLPCKSTNCQGDYQYGFRVPLLVISAYTPAGLINNSTHDFGSILRMIEGINHITEGALGFADKRATNDLSAFFVGGAPRTYVPVVAQKNANFFLTFTGPATDPDDY